MYSNLFHIQIHMYVRMYVKYNTQTQPWIGTVRSVERGDRKL